MGQTVNRSSPTEHMANEGGLPFGHEATPSGSESNYERMAGWRNSDQLRQDASVNGTTTG